MIVARQIDAAIKLRGLNRKQFAELMHRNPSEVTKWLSGKHNFTIALLQEISETLDARITGVEDVSGLVDGYVAVPEKTSLEEPAAVYQANMGLARIIESRSRELGLSAAEYLMRLVEADVERSKALPKIDLSGKPGDRTRKYSGIVKVHEINGDDKFDRIWNG